ncbi:MAG: alpha/beta hydrolase, partial [Bacteroidota bacterium]|nr:alpha/beta hydrolase [Bacteroidota bacterium]
MKRILLTFLITSACLLIQAQTDKYTSVSDISYYPESLSSADEYMKERCVLDLYHPVDIQGFPTVVWFHGGGLSGGNKSIPKELMNQGMAVVAVNYRLYPKVKAPVYIEDAAAAVAWVFNHIEDYGGDPDLIFITGHSAGGYLTSMVGMDKRWLKEYEIDANRIAGLIPFSGH